MNFKQYSRILIFLGIIVVPLSIMPSNSTKIPNQYDSNLLNDFTNNSFFFPRPIYDSVGFEQASWHHLMFHKQKNGFAMQIAGMYAQSYDNLFNPAYFLFDFKNQLTISAGKPSTFTPLIASSTSIISGSTTTTTANSTSQLVVKNGQIGQICIPSANRDVLGQWVGITKSENLHLTLNPKQEQGCIYIEASQDINRFLQNSIFNNWFINFSMPVTWIQNNLGVRGDQEAVEAFSQRAFKYIKMSPGDMTSMQISQATISLGARYLSQDDIQIMTTSGVIIPLSEQPCGGSLFEPIQGFNSHFGFDFLVHFQFPIIQKESNPSRILFFMDLHNNFLSRNHQLRTYDIKNKPFSRYMQLYDNFTNELVPAMNALTIRSRVEPYNIVNFSTGFRFAHHACYGEIGYELWAHGDERVTPEPVVTHSIGWWDDLRYGIAFINSDGNMAKIDTETGTVVAIDPNSEFGQTASESTINFVAPPDGKYNCCPTPSFTAQNKYLILSDLNIYTPASRSTITHRGFVSVGLGDNGKKRNYFVNFGAFIEAPQNNAALNLWGGWLKGGFTF
ncbi:hypothetical protein HYV10_01115 [Candidatus Dependentiae bacterium]|nr:hypothetical protein [Candidatus Dependentiae bacterium]